MNPFRRVVLSALAVGLLAVLSAASPASAHTGFESSQPADGELSDAPVAEIALRFTGPADPAGEGFVVLDPSGVMRSPDTVEVDAERRVWTLGFDPPLAGGAVGVRWTVQAPDAHPIAGAFDFTAGGPAPESEAAALEDEASAAGMGEPQESADIAASPVDPAEVEPLSAVDLDTFLAQGGVAVPYATGVGVAGRLVGFLGTALVIGGLAFAALVVRDDRRDLRSVLGVVGVAALAIVFGTVVDVAARVVVAGGGWGEVFDLGGFGSVVTSTFGVAVGLRVAAGALVYFAVRLVARPLVSSLSASEHRDLVAVGGETIDHRVYGVDRDHEVGVDDLPADRSGTVQTSRPPGQPEATWQPVTPAIVALVGVLLVSFTFDGHTVAEGNRLVTAVVDMVHVAAASIWAGGVAALAVVLWRRHRRSERLNGLELALRFSPVAGAGLAVAGIAGIALAAIILDEVSQLWTTPWGQLFAAKTLAVATAAAVGTYNHFVIIPWMNQDPSNDTRSARIRNTATVEAILVIIVIGLTAAVVGASSQ